MGSQSLEKPHAVCVPFATQGHINGMLKLAKVLHYKGFHITFVNTEHSHRRILKSRGPSSLDGVSDFRFETIPDGLPPAEDVDDPRDVGALSVSIQNTCSVPLHKLISKLNEPTSGVPPVSCIVSDSAISSITIGISDELHIPNVFFCSASACGYMGVLHYNELVQRGIVPLKGMCNTSTFVFISLIRIFNHNSRSAIDVDEAYLTNEYLEAPIDWIPGMKNMRLKDLPSFMRTTNLHDVLFNFLKDEAQGSFRATAIMVNTFEDLEGTVLNAMSSMLPPIYPIGPLPLLARQSTLETVGSNFWAEDTGCLKWLEEREAGSVVYVNFGSFTVMTNQQLIEFAWGLADSGCDFLWVIRPDLVDGDSAVLPVEFLSETSRRSKLASWCPQEAVLQHAAIGGFLTHCGWNSTLESLCEGVPMICWPFFAEQQTNCRYLCAEWGIGMEIDNDVRREAVERLIKELMGGEKGKEMKRKAMEWKVSAVRATHPGGSSVENLDRVIKDFILHRTRKDQKS